MGGLVLKLSPHERILVNGAVIENGDRRTKISIVSPGANILRLKDAIHPDSAKTPVSRVCYVVQLILSGDIDTEAGTQEIIARIEQLSLALTDHDSRRALSEATDAILEGKHYQCLKALRSLLPREKRLLFNASN